MDQNIDLCVFIENQTDKHLFKKDIYNSYQLILLLLILLVQYGYKFNLLGRKHMLYLVYLFERFYDKCELSNDLNDSNFIRIEEAMHYNILEHQEFVLVDDKYLDDFIMKKQSKEIVLQQIINNSQFQFLLGEDSVYVCILEQLLKLSEICSYKYEFINIVQTIQQEFKLQNQEDLYIKGINLLKIAFIQLLLQNYNLCNKYIGDLIQINKFNAKYYALQGRIFTLTGNLCQAIETLSVALSYDGKNYDHYYHIGIALYNNDQYEEALAAFEISFQINNNIRSMLFLGSCYYKLQCDILALSWINKALKLSPKNKDGLFLKQQILSVYFERNVSQIMEIRQNILKIDYIYLTRSNNICKLLQSQLEPYNQILDINMAFFISKYYPIEFYEPKIYNEKLPRQFQGDSDDDYCNIII